MNTIALRVLLLLLAATLLSGCFESTQPKFPLASAAAIFGDGGRYVVYERGEGGDYKRQEVFTIKPRPDRAYDIVNEKSETMTMSFHAIAGGAFVGQAQTEKDGDVRYGYVTMRAAGNDLLLYLPQCDKQDRARLNAAGVTLRTQYECIIDGVADPAALFATLDIGEPVSKLVRE